jgi:hypothetical protein
LPFALQFAFFLKVNVKDGQMLRPAFGEFHGKYKKTLQARTYLIPKYY